MNRISGKLILITGASSGIGAACAHRFAAEGARLALWARRQDRLEQLARELVQGRGDGVRIAAGDVRDRAGVNRATTELVAAGRVPRLLVHNAGLASGLSKLQAGDADECERMLDTD